MPLETYRKKRDFSRTPEPKGSPRVAAKKKKKGLRYVIQKHAATRLHYDFRLELDGVLKSWAVPKGPSLDPAEKRLAVHVEDHPLEYGGFEGVIPKGQYGGGTVIVWDRGTWVPEGDPARAYAEGKLKFQLQGEKLRGGWTLVRMHGARASDDGENWLLIKERDEEARPGSGDAIVVERPESVLSGKTIEEIANDPRRVWDSKPEGGGARRATAADRRASAAAHAQKTARRAARTAGTAAAPETSSAGRGAARREGPVLDPQTLPGARRAPLARKIEPQLATLVAAPPGGDEWIHEIKYDGYRVFAEVDGGRAKLLTRRGKDWTDHFSPIGAAAATLPVRSAVLDGEVVVLEPDGRTSFQALQNALSEGRGDDLVYFAFDLLYLDGYDLRAVPLGARKEALETVLAAARGGGPLRWSDHVQGDGKSFFRQACSFALEGVVSKRADLSYHPGRSRDWLKVKCLQRQEMVIGGFTDPEGSRTGLGALLVGVYEGGELRYAGKVGTGFTTATLEQLRRRLDRLERREPPFSNPPRGAEARGVHWVEPKLVAEVAFTEWTRDGHLRHPTFKGLREDKDPREVVREVPEATEAASDPEPARKSSRGQGHGAKSSGARSSRGKAAKAKSSSAKSAKATSSSSRGSGPRTSATVKADRGRAASAPAVKPDEESTPAAKPRGASKQAAVEVAGVRLSNPDKVLYPDRRLTKRDLALYYERIADWILPHLRDRPLTIVRCPDGQQGQCFYQKHVTDQFPKSIVRVEIEEGGKTVNYGAVNSLAGLVALVQMGVLELHIWGAHRDRVERPDYAVFDLDPDEGLAWSRVVEGARLMRDLLAELGLRSFLKTTGGKGLHVVLPLARRHGWDEVKSFTKAVAEMVAAADPARYTSHMPKAQRAGRIYIDYLRNQRGATSIAAYSTRSRPGAPVSAPLAWDELDSEVRGNTFTVESLPQRLDRLAADPWAEFAAVRQWITADMRRAVGLQS
jgi:bifunctional non-homologous end joining protein LigD